MRGFHLSEMAPEELHVLFLAEIKPCAVRRPSRTVGPPEVVDDGVGHGRTRFVNDLTPDFDVTGPRGRTRCQKKPKESEGK